MKRSHLILISFAILLIVGGVVGYPWIKLLLIQAPDHREFTPPAKTQWVPKGERAVSQQSHAVIPIPDTFHTMHVGLNNTDEIYSVTAPMVEFDWVAEEKLYVPEGPTFDNEGNLYFSPLSNDEGVSLVSLDRVTGKRRWAIKAAGNGGGAPLILNDPDNPTKQIIYHCTYTKAWAIHPDGTIIWEVESGLELPEGVSPNGVGSHCWGMNYIPQADAVTALTQDARIYLLDRRTGRSLLAKPYELPGKLPPPAKQLPEQSLLDEVDAVMKASFNKEKMFTQMINVVFGGGFQVSNFYGVDPNTSRMFIAATAPDVDDGKVDGRSDYGALYSMEAVLQDNGLYTFKVLGYKTFPGGTGSTPTIKFDSNRVLVSDSDNNVIALDLDLKELWKLNLGEQVAASLAVASDNNEIFAISKANIFKILDKGTSAEVVWKAKLDMYPETRGYQNYQNLTPTITANGIAVALAGGYFIKDKNIRIPTKVGVGLLDRETGELRYYTESPEEAIAVTTVGPDGGIYLANAPVRRAIARAKFGDKVPALLGGITRHKPIRLDLLVRDATCAGAARVANTLNFPQSATEDIRQLRVLIDQSQNALTKTHEKDLSRKDQAQIKSLLEQAESSLSVDTLKQAGKALTNICDLFE